MRRHKDSKSLFGLAGNKVVTRHELSFRYYSVTAALDLSASTPLKETSLPLTLVSAGAAMRNPRGG